MGQFKGRLKCKEWVSCVITDVTRKKSLMTQTLSWLEKAGPERLKNLEV